MVVFQPHRYSRVHELLSDFAKSFEWCDHLFVTDIYAAREKPLPGVTVEKILQTIQESSTVPCAHLPKGQETEQLHAFLRPHDVLVTLGAGDITNIHQALLSHFHLNPPLKWKVGLLFGGCSCEHEISLRSARFVDQCLNRDLYDVHYFGIDKKGEWVVGEEAHHLLHHNTTIASAQAKPLLSDVVTGALNHCELFFPVLHGPFGEDGTLQGFLELLGKPYAGPGFRGAAICMDKVLTKRLIAQAGVPTPPFVTFEIWEWQRKQEQLIQAIESLKFPVFVKPSHIGSSVGISKIEKKQDLSAAIEYAFQFDTTILVEQAIVGGRELEFAVMGNHEETIFAPPPGEKLSEGSFVDYEKKYGTQAIKTSLDAQLPKALLEKGRAYAEKAYKAVGNTGMTRVDFLLDKEGEFWCFEMNPIPGLTPLSLFPKIWKREGVEGPRMMDRLICMGLERFREIKRRFRPL